MWPPPPPGSRKLIDTWRKNGEAPASPESPATVPESDSDAPLEAAEAPDPAPAPAPTPTRPQGISNNDDAPAWAHSPTGDHSPRARRNAWGAASTSGLPSWASTPPTEPEPSWAEDGIRPPASIIRGHPSPGRPVGIPRGCRFFAFFALGMPASARRLRVASENL